MPAPATPRATFGKHERLCGPALIKLVATTGKSVNEPPLRLVGKVMPLKTTATAQIAFAVPKRHLKLAVDRNRMKRLMREAYRLNKERWLAPLRATGKQCAWLFIYQTGDLLTFVETQERISRALDRWTTQYTGA